MSEDGSTKDDVKVPDGEIGDKINKLFVEDGKDTSELSPVSIHGKCMLTFLDVIVLTAMGEECAIDAKTV
jgi:translation initiation factor 5A